jgi:gentisate 1,2-dioxygenase
MQAEGRKMSSTSKDQTVPHALREAWRAAHMVPLWESPTAHKLDVEREQTQIWPWAQMEPILEQTAEISSPAAVERRVMSLVNRKSKSPEDEATCGLINACLQTLLPGERARPHRHSMNALRFVLKGQGARTIVDGKDCVMEPGDLVITPAWAWHEHVHEGEGMFVWLDVLDVALHLQLGTDEFEPGPTNIMPEWPDDDAFGVANMLPVTFQATPGHSPVFRYPYTEASMALQRAPKGLDGLRRVRYVDPTNGGAAMAMLDCTLTGISGGQRSVVPFKSTASTVCCVVKGSGVSEIGGKQIAWGPHDVFTIPANDWSSHSADTDTEIFMVSNRDVYKKLGLLAETFGD